MGGRTQVHGGIHAPVAIRVYARHDGGQRRHARPGAAVWTGIGTIGTAVAGMVLLGEPAGALRLLSIGLIAAGIVGLKLLTPA